MSGRYRIVELAAATAMLLTNIGPNSPALAQSSTCGTLAQQYPSLKGRALVVEISPAPANYSATDPNDPANVIGIEPDLLKSAADCLGFTFSYSKLDFAGLIPAIQSGRIQIIAAGMYASAERAKQIDFVEYMKAGEASLIAAGNPKKLQGLGDACGVTAAEVVGTVENAILDRQSEACTAAGKAAISPLQFPSNDRAYSALAQGRADIFMTDAGVASFLAATTPDKVQVGFAIPTDFVFGLGISKKEQALRDGLLASFKAQSADGGLKASMKKWGFADAQFHEPSATSQ